MAAGSLYSACYQSTGARGLVLLLAVDQHVHLDASDHRGQGIANAPPRLQAAAWAAGCTGKNNASWHARLSDDWKGG